MRHQQPSVVSTRERISRMASCASPPSRPSHLIVSAAMSTHCGGKRAKSYLRWNRCGAASSSQSVQAFHSRFGDASLAAFPMSSSDDSRAHRGVDLTHAPSIHSTAFVLIGARNPGHDSRILRKRIGPLALRSVNEAVGFDSGEEAKASNWVTGDMEGQKIFFSPFCWPA